MLGEARCLANLVRKRLLPSIQAYQEISQDDYQILKAAVQEEKDVLKYWNNVKVKSFSTDIEKKDRLTKGERVDIQCTVELGQVPTKLFCAELFYMLGSNSRFRIIPMQIESRDNLSVNYQCSFEVGTI